MCFACVGVWTFAGNALYVTSNDEECSWLHASALDGACLNNSVSSVMRCATAHSGLTVCSGGLGRRA